VVEGVAGRQDQGHDWGIDPQLPQLGVQSGKHRLARSRADDDHQLRPDVADQSQHVDPESQAMGHSTNRTNSAQQT